MVRLSERLRLPELTELCRKYSVKRLSVFGSALSEEFSDESDIDFIVEFGTSPEISVSRQYFDFAHELEEMYGRSVDLVERNGIKNPYFRESLEEQEVSVFAA